MKQEKWGFVKAIFVHDAKLLKLEQLQIEANKPQQKVFQKQLVLVFFLAFRVGQYLDDQPSIQLLLEHDSPFCLPHLDYQVQYTPLLL